MIIAVAAVTALAACALTMTPQTAAVQPINARFRACARSAYEAPEAYPIRAKWPFDPAIATPEQLSDPAYATAPEVAAIGTLYSRIMTCRAEQAAGLAGVAAALVPAYSASDAVAKERVAELEAGTTTWGSFNTLRKKRILALEDQAAAILSGSESASATPANDIRVVDLAPGTGGAFTFSVRTNTVMTENSDGTAERIRRDWLAEALTLGGVCSTGYVVDSRRFVQPQGGLFANGGDIVYAGRCLPAGVNPAVVRP
jgi:hypothetical protein